MKKCPYCGAVIHRVAHRSTGEILVIINGKRHVKPPQDVITFYPCGHRVEKAKVQQ